MLTRLIIENFKAFGSRQVIPLAPITLLYGPNSSGKSSILQALLALKQTLSQSSETNAPLLLKGPLVDLGSIRDVLYGHDLGRECEIALVWRSDEATASPASEGIGLRIGRSEETGRIGLKAMPVYAHSLDAPAYIYFASAVPQEPGQTTTLPDPRLLDSSETRWHLIPILLNDQHPFWGDLFKVFDQGCRQRLITGLGIAIARSRELLIRGIVPQPYSRELMDSVDDRLGAVCLQAISSASNCHLQDDSLIGWDAALEAADGILTSFCRSDYGVAGFVEDFETAYGSRLSYMRGFGLFDLLELYRTVRSAVFAALMEKSGETKLADFFGYEPDLSGDILDAPLFELLSAARKNLHSVCYIGPIRSLPERFYADSGAMATAVGATGQYAPDMLFRNDTLLRRLNSAVSEFGIGYEVVVSRPNWSGMADMYAIRLIDERTRTMVSIKDVGFGISQVLPVIIQAYAGSGQCILIEQPELHLHPKLQAGLGSIFADSAKQFGNQFVIETHSEHLMLRLQRLIRKGELKASDVSVIYVMRDADGSTCLPLRLDDDGDFIDRWPGGFFEDDYREVFGD